MVSKKQAVTFKIAAFCLFAIAILHIAIIIGGPTWYLYFGAGNKMAEMSAAGSPFPAIATLIVAILFAIMGLYALSGSGAIRKLPLLRAGLIIISVLFLLRGLAVLHQTAWYFQNPDAIPLRELLFSLAALIIGILYTYGIVGKLKR